MPIAPNQTMAALNPPPVEPPTVGLLAALDGTPYLIEGTQETTDGADTAQRWVGGYQYLPEQYLARFGALDPCNLQAGGQYMDPPSSPGMVAAMPFVVWAGDRCAATGFAAHDYEGRAQRALLASTSAQVAHELWTGYQAQMAGWPNGYLAGPQATIVTPGPVSPGAALALLDGALGEVTTGQRAMIHCSRQAGIALSELGNTFRSVNGQILTYMNTVICPDAGYPGTGPTGGAEPPNSPNQWMYATLMPTVRLSPVEVIPATFAEAMIRGTNEIDWRAIRYASVSSPGVLLAAQVALQTPAVLAAS